MAKGMTKGTTTKVRQIAVMMAPLLLLGACGLFDGDWFGEGEAPPLPGKRISVLVYERALTPDPELKDTQILLPPPSLTPDWPQAGGYANHAMHHLAIGKTLTRAWTANAGAAADDEMRLNASPVVGDGRIFTMDTEARVTAFDAGNGRTLWRTRLTPKFEDDGHIPGGLAYENGLLYATTGFGRVVALDAATGRHVWWRQVDGPIRTAPTVRGGRVFVLTVDNTLHALNANDGSPLWTHSGSKEIASILGGGSPAVDSGIVIAAYSSGELVALNAANGRVAWTESLAAQGQRSGEITTLSHIRGRPVIDRGRVFAVSQGSLMVAIDLRTGRRLWDKDIGGLESPWVAGNYLFVLSGAAEVVALSRQDGRIHWVQQLPRFEDPEDRDDPIIWTGPLLASDRLIIAGSHGKVLTLSPYTGEFLGQIELPDGVTVPPVIANRTLYFLTDDAELIAYR